MPKKNVKPTPVLRFHTAAETERAEKIKRLLDDVLAEADGEMPGAHARLVQFISGLINPYWTSFIYKDHDDHGKAAATFSSRVAARRRDAFATLHTEGLTYEEIADLVGLSRSGVVAVRERAEGKRAKQVRITLKDAERLIKAKAEDSAVVPAGAEPAA